MQILISFENEHKNMIITMRACRNVNEDMNGWNCYLLRQHFLSYVSRLFVTIELEKKNFKEASLGTRSRRRVSCPHASSLSGIEIEFKLRFFLGRQFQAFEKTHVDLSHPSSFRRDQMAQDPRGTLGHVHFRHGTSGIRCCPSFGCTRVPIFRAKRPLPPSFARRTFRAAARCEL